MDFSKQLITWYLENKRDLPWRKTNNPYHIWLSEIILQQTRVQQGLPYYLAFINQYPTIQKLALAPEEDVLKLWQGLGYYSRARNLHFTAKYITNELNGSFPDSFIELKKLKGIGDYTAAAIASFAFNENVAVVDGNVYRVLSRFFAIENDISLGGTKKVFFDLATKLIPKNKAHDFNQAIMDFGATQCTPQNPDCSGCPLANNCISFSLGKTNYFPVKSKKTKTTNRHIIYILVYDLNKNIIVQKRTEKGIWHNLYELPNIETSCSLTKKEAILSIKEKYPNATEITSTTESTILHKLSHQHLHIAFYKIRIGLILDEAQPFADIIKLPYPIVLYNFLKELS